jgi:hypothetical protein
MFSVGSYVGCCKLTTLPFCLPIIEEKLAILLCTVCYVIRFRVTCVFLQWLKWAHTRKMCARLTSACIFYPPKHFYAFKLDLLLVVYGYVGRICFSPFLTLWRPVVTRIVSRVAQSVYCLATGWTPGRSRFDPRQRRNDFSSVLCVHAGSKGRPASCPKGTGSPFSGVKRGRGVTLIIHPHLVSRMSRGYTPSPPKRLRGV